VHGKEGRRGGMGEKYIIRSSEVVVFLKRSNLPQMRTIQSFIMV